MKIKNIQLNKKRSSSAQHEMDPTTAITTILSLIPDLLVTRGGRLIAGTYIGGRYYSTTALLKSGYIYSGGLIYAAGRIKNPWIRFLKVFRRYVNKSYNLPDRRKIATEIYRELKKSGQLQMLIRHRKLPPEIKEKLDKLLVITPKTGLEVALATPTIEEIEPEERLFRQQMRELMPPGEAQAEAISRTVAPSAPPEEATEAEERLFRQQMREAVLPSPRFVPRIPEEVSEAEERLFRQQMLEQPSAAPPLSLAEYRLMMERMRPEKQEQKIQQVVAQENIAEAIDKAVKQIPPGVPQETKKEIVVKNIQETQKQLVSEGNLAATDPSVVVKAAADAAIGTSGEKKETISKAAAEVTGTTPQEVKQEIKQAEQTVGAVTGVSVPVEVPKTSAEPKEEKKEEKVEETEEEKKKEPELVASGRRRSRSRRVTRRRRKDY